MTKGSKRQIIGRRLKVAHIFQFRSIFFPAFFTVIIFAVTAFNWSEVGFAASPQDMKWFNDAKFGMFIHWGPCTLKGTEISWSRAGARPGFDIPGDPPGTIPPEEYDNLYKQFNPTKFNADQWMDLAKSAGMKYVVFGTKHHDGFCMFDTKQTDYNIMHTPFRRDVTAEIADACHKKGLKLGLYFSAPDWVDPDIDTKNHEKFLERFRAEIRELCTNYGKVSVFWFDLGFKNVYDCTNTIKMVRELQPGVLVNDRLEPDPGDFTCPEQEVGPFDRTRTWESCITMGTQWSWKPNDEIKSKKECIQALVSCVIRDGNFLLNVGPNSLGEIEPLQQQRLREMGAWLKKYGKSIYFTRGGPFMLGKTGGSCYRGKTIYLHILDWPGDMLTLPAISPKIKSAKVLTGGEATWKQTDAGIEISVPKDKRDEVDTIIALDLDGTAAEIKPIRTD